MNRSILLHATLTLVFAVLPQLALAGAGGVIPV